MMRRVYLDHAATTPLDPKVFEAMEPFLKEHFGNASSVHSLGRKARFAVEESRERIASLLGAEPGEVVFTSGGTEADNTALRGMMAEGSGHLVTSAVEHEAVLRPAERLRDEGHDVTVLRPEAHGAVTAQAVREALTPNTRLVSLMHANNEIGTVSPVAEIAEVCRAANVCFHSDAVQTAGLLPVGVDELGVDMLTLSGHKMYGPKGIGVLYVRGGTDVRPLVEGGAQERRRRGGTENVAAIVGLAKAFELAILEREARAGHVTALRDRLYRLLRDSLGGMFVLNTPLHSEAEVAPHILNISFPPQEGQPLDGEMLLLNLDMEGVMVSAGSACTSGALEPSHVLLALGHNRATAAATVRFSLGKGNTEADIDYAVDRLAQVVRRMQRRPLASEVRG